MRHPLTPICADISDPLQHVVTRGKMGAESWHCLQFSVLLITVNDKDLTVTFIMFCCPISYWGPDSLAPSSSVELLTVQNLLSPSLFIFLSPLRPFFPFFLHRCVLNTEVNCLANNICTIYNCSMNVVSERLK